MSERGTTDEVWVLGATGRIKRDPASSTQPERRRSPFVTAGSAVGADLATTAGGTFVVE